MMLSTDESSQMPSCLASGKTCLLDRYINGTWDSSSKNTVGAAFSAKRVRLQQLRLQICQVQMRFQLTSCLEGFIRFKEALPGLMGNFFVICSGSNFHRQGDHHGYLGHSWS